MSNEPDYTIAKIAFLLFIMPMIAYAGFYLLAAFVQAVAGC